MFEVSVTADFSAAHALQGYDGKCANVHGHNFVVEAFVKAGATGSDGITVDFLELKTILRETVSELDHKLLNEVPPFDQVNPTSENIARWIFSVIEERLESDNATLSAVKVAESPDCSVIYTKDEPCA